jgi:hypothetical protein
MKKRMSFKGALDIHTKIKIITYDKETLSLWSEVISSRNQGEFYNPKTHPLKKSKKNKSMTLEKYRTLNHEFFKWLGNFL